MVEILKKIIRDIPDFPKKGILFKDITTLLKDPIAFQEGSGPLEPPLCWKGHRGGCWY